MRLISLLSEDDKRKKVFDTKGTLEAAYVLFLEDVKEIWPVEPRAGDVARVWLDRSKSTVVACFDYPAAESVRFSKDAFAAFGRFSGAVNTKFRELSALELLAIADQIQVDNTQIIEIANT